MSQYTPWSSYTDQGLKYNNLGVSYIIIAHLLYADDPVLLATTAEGLQSQLHNLYSYCQKWHLIVSMTKTNVMIFNAKKKHKISTFSYNNEVVEMEDSYKYLEFLICSNYKDGYLS